MRFDDLYRFRSVIGFGAYGVVMKAIHRERQEEVAVKVSWHDTRSSTRKLLAATKVDRVCKRQIFSVRWTTPISSR